MLPGWGGGLYPQKPPPQPVVLGWPSPWLNGFPFTDQGDPFTYSVASEVRDCLHVISQRLQLAFLFCPVNTSLNMISRLGGAVAGREKTCQSGQYKCRLPSLRLCDLRQGTVPL